ncbi:MAG TPA: acyltransferase domain-containing protein [Solirubrobacteraceae bacterium]|jgi:acyl transferase domain-containing protein
MSRQALVNDVLTAALFDGSELRGCGPGGFVEQARPDVVAGHGFGDLAALVAAGALRRRDALRLAIVRDQLVEQAAAGVGGGMLAVTARDAEAAASRLVERTGVAIARHDSPERVVLAGSQEHLEHARAVAALLGIAVADLPATAALHSRALGAAAEVFEWVLESVSFHEPAIPVYSSVTAALVGDDPRNELAQCLDMPVLWTDTVRALQSAGAARFVVCGSAHELGELGLQTLTGARELVDA